MIYNDKTLGKLREIPDSVPVSALISGGTVSAGESVYIHPVQGHVYSCTVEGGTICLAPNSGVSTFEVWVKPATSTTTFSWYPAIVWGDDGVFSGSGTAGVPTINDPNTTYCTAIRYDDGVILANSAYNKELMEIRYKAPTKVTPTTTSSILGHWYRDGEGAIELAKGTTDTIQTTYFKGTNITSVSIPTGITNFGLLVQSCTNLSAVTMPNTVSDLAWNFISCYSLKSVTIPASVNVIGGQAFQYCTSLHDVTFSGTPSNGITDKAFLNCWALSGGTINMPWVSSAVAGEPWGAPAGVTLVHGGTAFEYKGKTDAGVEEIYMAVHYKATQKPELNNSGGVVTDIYNTTTGEGTIYLNTTSDTSGWLNTSGKSTTQQAYITSITYPAGIKTIKTKECYRNLEAEITIPDTVECIESYAFTNINSVNLPSNLKVVNNYGLEVVKNWTAITIPSGVTSLGAYCMRSCANLSSVTFLGTPSSGGTILSGAIANTVFSGCTALTTIKVPWSAGVIEGAPWGATNATVHYTDKIYYTATSQATIGDGAMSQVEAHTFDAATGTGTITLSGGVTAIGNKGIFFSSDNNIKTLSLPTGHAAIWSLGLSCTALTDVDVPEGITHINGWTFNCCNALTSIKLPDTLLFIGPGSFNGWNSLQSITIPKNVNTIQQRAFDSCYHLSAVTFLGTPKYIRRPGTLDEAYPYINVFQNCTALAGGTITMPWSSGAVAGEPWGAPDGVTLIHGGTAYTYTSAGGIVLKED